MPPDVSLSCHLSRQHACAAILWRLRPEAIAPDSWLDLISVAGMLTSLLVTCGFPLCMPLLALCWFLYLHILVVGQTFLSFQWDIFLLEVGGLALLYAPLSFLSSRREPSTVGKLCLSWCLFKIMIMSGVVKVQARCPTWMGLTALHYHYATQCIPTPLGWYAHQLPHFIQKLSVMGTLLIEIPGSFLIIAPWREARVWAAWLNIFLMIAILLTGNYTFFNLLTASLCVPLLEGPDSSSRGAGGGRASEAGVETHLNEAEQTSSEAAKERNTLRRRTGALARESHNSVSVLHSDEHNLALRACDSATSASDRRRPSASHARAGWLRASIAWISPLAWLLASVRYLFRFSVRPHGAGGDVWCPADKGGTAAGAFQMTGSCVWHALEYKLDVAVDFTVDAMDQLVHLGLLWATPLFCGMLLFTAFREMDGVLVGSPRDADTRRVGVVGLLGRTWRCANIIIVAGVGVCYVLASLRPLADIAPPLAGLMPPVAQDLHRAARQWHLVSGYGLFRRMTGVGAHKEVLPNSGGLSLPAVARPELELQASDDGETWVPLEFAFKPGNVSRAPPWVGLPGVAGSFSGLHQPRLDWQMWFAALGSYQHNPWLLVLVTRLLQVVCLCAYV